MQASPALYLAASLLRLRRPHIGNAAAELLSSISNRPRKDKHRAVEGQAGPPALDSPAPYENPAIHLSSVGFDPRNQLDLSAFHPMLDIHPDLYSNPTPGVRTVLINETPILKLDPSTIAHLKANSVQDGNHDTLAELADDASTRFGLKDLRALHRYTLVAHRVVNMTSKGKQSQMYVLIAVGNGEGLLGYGEGKGDAIMSAAGKAFVQAVKNMDYVQRKDERTTWSNLMVGKWGATTVEIRSRPPGACGTQL